MKIPEKIFLYPELEEINNIRKYDYLNKIPSKKNQNSDSISKIINFIETGEELIKKEDINESLLFNLKQYYIILVQKQATIDKYLKNISEEKLSSQEITMYSFFIRKVNEEIIIILFQIYDKSFHVFNNFFDLNVDYTKLKNNFNNGVLEKIKEKEYVSIYNELKEIKQELKKVDCRNDIIHNVSSFQVNYCRDKIIYAKDFDQIDNIVIEINKLLRKHVEIMINSINKEE